MIKKVICTTTISDKPNSIFLFADRFNDWDIIVAGDLKTPHKTYEDDDRIIYLTPEMQHSMNSRLSNLIGWNCIQRRNFAYIEACRRGYDVIASVDDDIYPYDTWGTLLLDMPSKPCQINATIHESNTVGVLDPLYVAVNKEERDGVWQRGFPIQLLHKREYSSTKDIIKADIQVDFCDGILDVDAICRVGYPYMVSFGSTHFPFSSYLLHVFYSQNTFIKRSVLKDYFLFPQVGRMDDIYAALYISSFDKYKIIYNKPSAWHMYRKRDLNKEALSELHGYLNCVNIVKAMKEDRDFLYKFIPIESHEAFLEYRKEVS